MARRRSSACAMTTIVADAYAVDDTGAALLSFELSVDIDAARTGTTSTAMPTLTALLQNGARRKSSRFSMAARGCDQGGPVDVLRGTGRQFAGLRHRGGGQVADSAAMARRSIGTLYYRFLAGS